MIWDHVAVFNYLGGNGNEATVQQKENVVLLKVAIR